MTRKHFEALAKIIRSGFENAHPTKAFAPEHVVRMMQEDIADFCEAQNDLFDRIRFDRACGVRK